MSRKQAPSMKPAPKTARAGASSGRSGSSSGGSTLPWIVGGIVAIVAVIAVAFFVVGGRGPAGSDAGTVVRGNGGTWTDITPDRLASEMKHKDFTLLNVKTPYIGEIEGTDLYIPYSDVAARASELPADKTAKIVVYCRTGRESAVASQTLLDLGYTNIENLDGGMEAWTASGRSLVDLGRS